MSSRVERICRSYCSQSVVASVVLPVVKESGATSLGEHDLHIRLFRGEEPTRTVSSPDRSRILHGDELADTETWRQSYFPWPVQESTGSPLSRQTKVRTYGQRGLPDMSLPGASGAYVVYRPHRLRKGRTGGTVAVTKQRHA